MGAPGCPSGSGQGTCPPEAPPSLQGRRSGVSIWAKSLESGLGEFRSRIRTANTHTHTHTDGSCFQRAVNNRKSQFLKRKNYGLFYLILHIGK